MKNKQERSNRPERARTAGVSADLLKLTAIITMLIDHIGAGILERLLIDGYVTDYALYLKIYQLDSVLRIIGRISFPIFGDTYLIFRFILPPEGCALMF